MKQATWMMMMAALVSTGALAQTPAETCRSIGLADSIVACMAAIANHEVQPAAALTCRSIGLADSVVQCMRVIADKQYTTEELQSCRSIGLADQIVQCMSVSGQRPQPKRANHRRDNDDDDRSAGAGAWVSVRFTNRYPATVARFYWKLVGERRYREARLPGQVRTNEYVDVTLPNEVVAICVESRDGQRLWWSRLDVGALPDASLAIDEEEENWADGRCSDKAVR